MHVCVSGRAAICAIARGCVCVCVNGECPTPPLPLFAKDIHMHEACARVCVCVCVGGFTNY